MATTFTNRASLSYGGNTVISNTVTGEIAEVLGVTKTAVTDEYRPGEPVTYIVTLTNSGSTELSALTLTDNLGAYTFNGTTLVPLTYDESSVKYFINGDLVAAPTVAGTSPLTITGLTVPAGGNTAIVYTATPNDFAPPAEDGTITNTVEITGTGLTDVTATETVATEDAPELRISKGLCPTSVTENGTIEYTFIIENFGNTAATDAVLTDTFNPRLTNIVATLNGTALTAGTDYTYDAATGLFTTVAGKITVPAATYTQNATTGAYTTVPGSTTLVVTGAI